MDTVCSPLDIHLRIDGGGGPDDNSHTVATLETPVSLFVPSEIPGINIGYIELVYIDETSGQVEVCRYDENGEFRNCSAGLVPGDTITSKRFEIGSEGLDAGTLAFDPEVDVARCGTACVDSPDNCGGYLSCKDDGNACTVDTCDEETGEAHHEPVAAGESCADNDVCDGDEVCDEGGQCGGGTPIMVDDEDPCTADQCTPGVGVEHQAAFETCNEHLEEFMNSWCESGELTSLNQPYLEYCLGKVADALTSVRTAQDEQYILEATFDCIAAGATCAATGGGRDRDSQGKRQSLVFPPGAFARRFCSAEAYAAHQDCSRRISLTTQAAMVACLGQTAFALATGPGAAAVLGRCLAGVSAGGVFGVAMCLFANTISDKNCCDDEIACDGKCVYATTCPESP